jgi:hypothetical protein
MYMLFEKLHGYSKKLFRFWFSSKFRILKMIWFEPFSQRERNMTKVFTITTTSDVVWNASKPPTLIGVEKIPTPCAKLPKTMETFFNKSGKKN